MFNASIIIFISSPFLRRKHLSDSLYSYKDMTKIVGLKVHVRCDKCRTKSLMIAAEGHGVTAVSFEEVDYERLVVEGNRVEIADLVQTLTKKVGYTQILYVLTL